MPAAAGNKALRRIGCSLRRNPTACLDSEGWGDGDTRSCSCTLEGLVGAFSSFIDMEDFTSYLRYHELDLDNLSLNCRL